MCGIFALLNNENTFSKGFIYNQFMKGQGRGPEFSKLHSMQKMELGFHRLAINGLNPESNQPIVNGNITLICNGEIYNYKELYDMMNIEGETESDCEVIIHLYKKYGIDQTLQMLDGVFAFILCDFDVKKDSANLYVARDPYGVRPLYMLSELKTPNTEYHPMYSTNIYINRTNRKYIYGFASELKVLSEFYKSSDNFYEINHFKPGTYSHYAMYFKVNPMWELERENVRYHNTSFPSTMHISSKENYAYETIFENIQKYLREAVKKRVLVTERPIACLLSGGLDSSLITALVNEYYKKKTDIPLETYSIGLEGSEDLKYAQIVADYLGTKHTEIILSEIDFINAIPEVIYSIESYDTTSVRASIGNYLLGKYISQHSEAKVIFNGDGSDELCGGYLYMHAVPDTIEFDKECRRLLNDIHMFDVLRSDKCISSHGLEPRTPFLDRSWTQYYLSIHPQIRNHSINGECEKYLLRNAFSKTYFRNSEGAPLLPENVIWRTKEAFSDGVSKTTRSLYEIIQEYINNNELVNKTDDMFIYTHNRGDTNEKMYYRNIFESHYKGLGNVVPYFWMPRYVNANDASARTLKIYNKINGSEAKCDSELSEI